LHCQSLQDRELLSIEAAASKAAGLTMQPKAENKITIYGPKNDGTYWVEFKTDKGESRVISVPSGETAVLRHFQARMPDDVDQR
jgi:hypothetical protein